jgi:hypothetical protein
VQQAIHILEFWALAFLSLCAALVLLNIFFGLIENDLTLHSLGKEAAIAAVASLIEGTSVWVVATFIPLGGRALFIPALIVAIIYKVAHFEDWGRYEVFVLLMFQLVVGTFVACLVSGRFSAAFTVLFVFFICLAVIFAFMKGL